MNKRIVHCTHCLIIGIDLLSANVLVIEASKLNTYAKGHKWIETIKRFQ